MTTYQMGDLEARFADIVWANEPLRSAALADKAAEKFGWKKTTSYTVLKRLCNKGIFQNVKAVVSSCVTREEFYSGKTNRFVEETFGGSLVSFLTSYMGDRSLTDEEAAELHSLIDSFTGK